MQASLEEGNKAMEAIVEMQEDEGPLAVLDHSGSSAEDVSDMETARENEDDSSSDSSIISLSSNLPSLASRGEDDDDDYDYSPSDRPSPRDEEMARRLEWIRSRRNNDHRLGHPLFQENPRRHLRPSMLASDLQMPDLPPAPPVPRLDPIPPPLRRRRQQQPANILSRILCWPVLIPIFFILLVLFVVFCAIPLFFLVIGATCLYYCCAANPIPPQVLWRAMMLDEPAAARPERVWTGPDQVHAALEQRTVLRKLPLGEYDPETAVADDEMAMVGDKHVLIMGQASRKMMGDFSCDICLLDYEAGDSIAWSKNPACDHAYHADCIVDWLLRKPTCPSCRQKYVLDESGSG